MNIEVNLKKFKTTIKKKRKITLALMLSFLMTGTIGFAETPTVEELQRKIQELQNKIEQLEVKNKEMENRFKFEAVIAGKGAKIGGYEVPNEKIRGIAIGQEATIDAQGGNDEDYSIAIGRKARVTSNGLDFSSIALGDGAYVLNGSGKQEWALSFDSDNWDVVKGFFNVTVNGLKKSSRIPGGIAIGTDAYARTGSIQIGSHTYEGKMGGIEVIKNNDETSNDTNRQANIVNMTTIGTNSYQKAAMGTMVGAYNISTGNFDGSGGFNSFSYGAQNFGSSVFGTLNSIKSKGKNGTSGVANSIVGIANITENANGSLVFGAGNVIKNSNEYLSLTDTLTESFKNVDDAVTKFQDVIGKNKAGGATLAIGGANKADYTKQVSMIGTRNEIKGTSSKKTELVSVSGDNNLVENSRNIVAGKNFHVKGEGNVLQGFNKDGSKRNEVTNKNVVALGNDIKVSTDNSVYLGMESANSKDENTLWRSDKDKRDQSYKEYAGFDHIGGIVTVGNDTLTRVIQNVAPGLISATSTDAINGSQLYNYVAKQYITVKDGKGGETKVKLGDTLTLKGTTIDVTVKAPEPTQTNVNQTAVAPQPVAPVSEAKPQEHTVTYETDTFEYKLRDEAGKVTSLIEGADGKLYTQDFLDKNEYKVDKWVKKGTNEVSENLSDNQHEKNGTNVILSTKYGNIISNVSDGKKDTDAVNVKQLKEVEDKIKNISNDSIDEAKEKSNLALSGVANAIAIANLVQVNSYSDYRHNLSAAYGYYGKQHALAIGFSGVTENRRVGYKISGSVNTKGNLGLGVGVGVMLGEKSERKLYPEKSNLVKDLKEKVNMQNMQIEELKKENQEIKEMLKKIMKK